MNPSILISISIISAYLLGSIPTSYIFGKLVKGIDIRQHGSGNVGASNALRILGLKYGIAVLIFDIGKGIAAVLIAQTILGIGSDLFLVIVGLAAILGHVFTIFLGFKGGKGVATSAGVFICLTPIPVVITLVVFIIVVWISKYISLGSMLAALTLFLCELIINIRTSFSELEKLVFIAVVSLFIFIKHIPNIRRLIKGNENRLNFKKSRQ